MKEKKPAVFKGYLTEEKFLEICKERGMLQGDNPVYLPEGTIFSGHLTIEDLKRLCLQHLEIKSESDKYNPEKNDAVISLTRLSDGSWTAIGMKNGVLKKTRELMPDHALQQLLIIG